MTEERKRELMKVAIQEAKKSVDEDTRAHPKVGAVLADVNGNILYTSHRGEDKSGGHAEFHIFKKAEKDQCDLKDAVLFVTLEPCTRRGNGKVPCAVRVVRSGIKKIVIGTLDPNPHITGRGEMFLNYRLDVERFPSDLSRQLQELNGEFFEQYRNLQIPAVSPYVGGVTSGELSPFAHVLGGQREGILQQSMDLLTGSTGDILIFAGNLSWLRELQVSLVLAKTEGRRIRILCDKVASRDGRFSEHVVIAQHLGADVGLTDADVGIRGTLVGAQSEKAAMMCVEPMPTKHTLLFQAPHETGVIKAFTLVFESLWGKAKHAPAFSPAVRRADPNALSEALKRDVPQYRQAELCVAEIDISTVMPLTTALQRFKVFRLHEVVILQKKFQVECAVIEGSPWPIFPPVIEERENGQKVVIDGSHRLFSSMQRGIQTMRVILVKGADPVLPSDPLPSWDTVKVVSKKLPKEERYINYRPEAFRPIRPCMMDFVTRL